MKQSILYPLLVFFIVACSTSTTQNKEKTVGETNGDSINEKIEAAIKDGNASVAFDLLSNHEVETKLTLNDTLFMWYTTREPDFYSWFITNSKIQEGPSYFFVDEIHLRDLTDEVAGNELLIYAQHMPYSYIEAFAFIVDQDDLSQKILAAEYNGQNEDAVITIDPAPDEPNFGITDEFIITRDDYNLVTIESDADYQNYIAWIESNLASFSYGDGQPAPIPDHFEAFVEGDNLAPVQFSRSVTDFDFDLILMRSIYDHGEPTLSLRLAVYEKGELLKSSTVIDQEFMYIPSAQVSLENGSVKIFQEGYKLETDVNPDGTINTIEKSDTTYYYTINEKGELIASTGSESLAKLPAVAGDYDYGLMVLAINGDYLSGYYKNGRYEGNPNFGCSFLFYGDLSNAIEQRKMNIKTLNPFDLTEAPREGSLKLHSEEDEVFSIVAQLNGDDCWDRNLGFTTVSVNPGISFELYKEKNYEEVRLVTKETPLYDEAKNQTSQSLVPDDVVIVLEGNEEWIQIVCFTEEKPTEGFIKAGNTRRLGE